MSGYMTFETLDELLDYVRSSDYPKCFAANYLPEIGEYELWIGNQPYDSYEKIIKLEQKEKQWLYGKLNQISNIIGQGRREVNKFEIDLMGDD